MTFIGCSMVAAKLTAMGIVSAPAVFLVVGAASLSLAIIGTGLGENMIQKFYEYFDLEDFFLKLENKIESGEVAEEVTEYINSGKYKALSDYQYMSNTQ